MLNIPEEIKELLISDGTRKNFRVRFDDGVTPDITNENIVEESVTLTESICSETQLKFGLIETPVLEFETVGIGKIKGKNIEAFIEVRCSRNVPGAVYRTDIGAWVYPIPYGKFVIASCKKQADMTHRKIVAYNYRTISGWEMPRKTKETLAMMYAGTDKKPIKFSLETMMKILIKDYERNYQEHIASDYFYEKTFSKTINGKTYSLVLYTAIFLDAFHKNTGEIVTFNYISFIKKKYTPAYKEGLINISGILRDIGWTDALDIEALSNNGMGQRFSVSEIKSPHMYEYTFDDIQYIPYNFKIFDSNPDEDIIPDLLIVDSKQLSSTHWNAEEWITEEYQFPVRLKLINETDNVVLYDTGLQSNSILYEKEYDVTTSESKIFFGMPYEPITAELDVYDGFQPTGTTKEVDIYQLNPSAFDSIDWSEMIGGNIELRGLMSKFERSGEFSTFNLKSSFEDPQEITQSVIRSVWYDDDLSQEIGRITSTYTNEKGKDATAYLNIVDNYEADKYRRYSIARNVVIDMGQYNSKTMKNILARMGQNMTGIQYMPTELSCVGMPWIEAGDVLLIQTDDGIIPVLVESRTISGINNLIDDISCTDEETIDGSDSMYSSETETLILK